MLHVIECLANSICLWNFSLVQCHKPEHVGTVALITAFHGVFTSKQLAIMSLDHQL